MTRKLPEDTVSFKCCKCRSDNRHTNTRPNHEEEEEEEEEEGGGGEGASSSREGMEARRGEVGVRGG